MSRTSPDKPGQIRFCPPPQSVGQPGQTRTYAYRHVRLSGHDARPAAMMMGNQPIQPAHAATLKTPNPASATMAARSTRRKPGLPFTAARWAGVADSRAMPSTSAININIGSTLPPATCSTSARQRPHPGRAGDHGAAVRAGKLLRLRPAGGRGHNLMGHPARAILEDFPHARIPFESSVPTVVNIAWNDVRVESFLMFYSVLRVLTAGLIRGGRGTPKFQSTTKKYIRFR